MGTRPLEPAAASSRRAWRTRLPVAAALLFTLGACSAAAAPMTTLERQHVIAHLEMTERWLADEVSGLSPAQIEFRRAPDAWSILLVIEHLTITDPIYFQDLQKALKTPLRNPAGFRDDAGILWYGIDRTQRGQAIPAEDPTGQLKDLQAGLAALRKIHAQILQYARTTADDLRGHVVEREQCDAYQWLLLISTHDQRHILQIRETKADPKFPKK
jgi:hypothetical protein